MIADFKLLNKESLKTENQKKFVLSNGDISHVTHTGTSNLSNSNIIQMCFISHSLNIIYSQYLRQRIALIFCYILS